ncbi:MAG: molybdopterin-dependent oxidoreductase [Bryobacteraceae bacterium]|nr:molybdopterin-dependent oxidoreductase [Bryobacteraceae bacterium]
MSETRYSVCALDCPDACGLVLNIEDGKATRLRGEAAHPVTRGFLCGKVAQYLEREYSPQRLLYPQKRVGAKGEGRFARISWDEALDTIAGRLRSVSLEYGPEAVLPYSYGGTLGYLQSSGMDRRFFHRLGASRLDRTICASAGAAGMTAAYGNRLATEFEQFPDAKLIIAWGANIHGNNVHLWPFIVEARRRGARFYAIDPIATRTARLADRHFAVHPGSDLALALGLMHVIFAERLEDADYLSAYTENAGSLRARAAEYPPDRVAALAGITKEDIVALAREYATTKPAVIRLNYGIQRSERGGRAVHAVALLPVIAGQFRHVGGGIHLSSSGAFQINRNALERPDLQMVSPLGRPARMVNMSELSKALTELDEPPVKALLVYNSNPAAVAPHQAKVLEGLRREDLFTVVMEQFATDTADYADILLPATTFLEHTDLYFSYGHHYLQFARPALAAPGEAKSNFEVFRLLAARMGFEDRALRDSEDDVIRQTLESESAYLAGITLEELDEKRRVRLRVAPEGEPFLPYARGGFGTVSGKCDLDASDLGYEPPVESRFGSPELRQKYPLELIAGKHDDGMNSTFSYREAVDRDAGLLCLDAADAGERGIGEGDAVRVFNDRGSLVLKAHVNGSVRRGVVRIPGIRWLRKSGQGRNANVLTSDRLTDIGGGATFYSCLVQVEKCAD